MLTYRASYDTYRGKRWLSVKAISPEGAKANATAACPYGWKLLNVYLSSKITQPIGQIKRY